MASLTTTVYDPSTADLISALVHCSSAASNIYYSESYRASAEESTLVTEDYILNVLSSVVLQELTEMGIEFIVPMDDVKLNAIYILVCTILRDRMSTEELFQYLTSLSDNDFNSLSSEITGADEDNPIMLVHRVVDHMVERSLQSESLALVNTYEHEICVSNTKFVDHLTALIKDVEEHRLFEVVTIPFDDVVEYSKTCHILKFRFDEAMQGFVAKGKLLADDSVNMLRQFRIAVQTNAINRDFSNVAGGHHKLQLYHPAAYNDYATRYSDELLLPLIVAYVATFLDTPVVVPTINKFGALYNFPEHVVNTCIELAGMLPPLTTQLPEESHE
jgi:hypothetical protein